MTRTLLFSPLPRWAPLTTGPNNLHHRDVGCRESHNQCVKASAYLGGPMRTLPLFNFPAFEAATAALRAKGWVIHSPAEHDLETGFDPATTDLADFNLAGALVWDFTKIMESSCLIVLPGWEKSAGTTWEATVAYATGKPVFLYPELTPVALPKVVTDPVATQEDLRRWPRIDPIINDVTEQPYPPYDPDTIVREDLERSYAHMRGVDGPGAWSRLAESVPGDGHLTHTHPEQPEVHFHEFPVGPHSKVVLEHGSNPSEWRVQDPTTGAQKGQKDVRTDLLPADVLLELSRHYGRGSAKYADRNWEGGYKWSLSHAALLRHLLLFWNGEDIDHDAEIGDFPHLVAVVWHAVALLAFYLRSSGTDDRPGGRS